MTKAMTRRLSTGGLVRAAGVIVVALWFIPNAWAQQIQSKSQDRARIGLVLSGGGALGLAHIGVLTYFEEHHIPVDAVAGTSMGGLVGGLYATGIRAERLQEIALRAPWNDWLRASPKYEDRSIAEKQAWIRTDTRVTLQLKRNLALPVGLNPGQPLALLLSHHTAAYSDLRSFDELPIPFRCVATNLTDGDAFVLESGSLALALRATMAVPGLFTPVTLGNRVLIDGGVLDNIPVDAVRAMNADVAIAVTLEAAPTKGPELNSLTGILKQLVSVVIKANEKRSLKQADLVIPVQLQQFDSIDFARADKIVAAGYKAAQSMGEQLKKYGLNDADWNLYLHERERRIRTVPERGRIVAVASSQPRIQAGAENDLRRKLPFETDRTELENTLSVITAITSLPSAYYSWKDTPSAGYAVSLQERLEGGVFFRPSLFIEASGGEPTRASLNLSSATFSKTAYKTRLISELTIGYDPGVRMEYYAPLESKPFFIAPGFLIQRTNFPAYDTTGLPDTYRDRFAGTFYAGLGTWRSLQWRAGATGGYDRISRSVIVDGIASRSTGFVNAETTLLYDTQDTETLPSRGTRLDANMGYSFRDRSFPYFSGDYSHVFPISTSLGVFVLSRGATSFGRELDYFDQFTAGGLRDLPSYRFSEFHANTLATAGGGLSVPIKTKGFASVKPVFAAWYMVGRLDLGSKGWQTHQSTSIGVFGKTPLGTTGIVLSASETGDLRFRFVFGRFR